MVATGTLSPGDQILLSGYAEHTADRVWTVSAANLKSLTIVLIVDSGPLVAQLNRNDPDHYRCVDLLESYEGVLLITP